jgi:hypothetical protein
MTVEKIIEELVSLILIQEKEIDSLREENISLKVKIDRINQYIETYEEYIQGGNE